MKHATVIRKICRLTYALLSMPSTMMIMNLMLWKGAFFDKPSITMTSFMLLTLLCYLHASFKRYKFQKFAESLLRGELK